MSYWSVDALKSSGSTLLRGLPQYFSNLYIYDGVYGFNPVGEWVDIGVVVLRWKWDRADDATGVDAKLQSEILVSQ